MKLSIITPIYKGTQFLPKFFERMAEQTNKNFELVLVVDTNNQKPLSFLDEYKDRIKGDIKLVFNSKRCGRTNAVAKGVEAATGDYSIILSTSNRFNEETVDQLLDLVKEKKTDIIEFRARFWSPIRYKGKIRKKFNKSTNIAEDKSILAYSQPFEFNKIFKTSVLTEVVNMPAFNKRLNSRYSIELVFKAFIKAETYSTSNLKIIRSKKDDGILFNPLKLHREWEEMLSKDEFKDYFEALSYNQYFTYKVIYMGYLGMLKNKTLNSKFTAEYNNKFHENESNFFEANQYFVRKNAETDLLKMHKGRKAVKLYREF